MCKYKKILESEIDGSKIYEFPVLLRTIKLFTNSFTNLHFYQWHMRESKFLKSKNLSHREVSHAEKKQPRRTHGLSDKNPGESLS